MQYFGVPICPYCKKRVNVIRTWSLKKEGEYRCPRCQGISNIFLSPLIYVIALIAVFAGAAIFFFHRFILNDVTPSIVIQIILPFVLFFLVSLFMVHLQKPVIKKVSREEMEQKGRRKTSRADDRRGFESAAGPLPDRDAYLPQSGDPADAFATGPVRMGPPIPRETAAPSQSMGGELSSHTAVVDLPRSVPIPPRRRPLPGVQEGSGVARPAVPQVEYASKVVAGSSSAKSVPSASPSAQQAPGRQRSQVQQMQAPGSQPQKRQAPAVAEKLEKKDDYFAKYEDPAYIEKRLEDLRNKRK